MISDREYKVKIEIQKQKTNVARYDAQILDEERKMMEAQRQVDVVIATIAQLEDSREKCREEIKRLESDINA